jgi:hypothetical protein
MIVKGEVDAVFEERLGLVYGTLRPMIRTDRM